MVTRKSLCESKYIFLIGYSLSQIVGSKLPSNKQVLLVLFFNMREVKLNSHHNATLVIQETMIFWQKARIPTRTEQNCVKNWKIYTKNGEICRS